MWTTYQTLDPKFEKVIGVIGGPNWVEVTGDDSLRQLLFGSDYYDNAGDGPYLVTGTTRNSAVTDALTETGLLWADVVPSISKRGLGSILQQQDAVHAINHDYYQSRTIAACSKDVIRGSQDDSPVAFPVSADDQTIYVPNKMTEVYPGITKHQLLATPGSPGANRLNWVDLPQDSFNDSAIGAVILLAGSSADSIQEILICTLGAGWGSSTINTSSYAAGTSSVTSVIDQSALSRSILMQNATDQKIFPRDMSSGLGAASFFTLRLCTPRSRSSLPKPGQPI